ncbi:uncharacterized protein PFL1_06177 [Pseudozyma flocculosa PF-1]|uniref:Ubiquitin-like domain-containing protein n=2 Tax=Pseudozyma flocculosa TaxID=84751 RepID=A0A5C3F9Y1_9BASI|nr:uncharacterized protein PFL1_06177 [Pseudozyma flocculosa PF-1]EPQ26242.1 hypothetical protein PFL1_06177 [Pseudozyma flocculosa PF-1]SPO40201.1 uncharacterized protein PSFLO_05683 [Pseudozyma flocculosa]
MSDDEDDIDFYVRKPPPRKSRRRHSGSSVPSSASYSDDSDDSRSPYASDRSTAAKPTTAQTAKTSQTDNFDAPLASPTFSADAKLSAKARTTSPVKRRRSPSLTPPPEPPEMQLKAARQLVRQHLASFHAQTSFSSDEDEPAIRPDPSSQSPETTLVLDPELARYYRGKDAERVREHARQQEAERRERRRRQLSQRRSESVGAPNAPATGTAKAKGQESIAEESDGFEVVPGPSLASPPSSGSKNGTGVGAESKGSTATSNGAEVITLSDSEPEPAAARGTHPAGPPSSSNDPSASAAAASKESNEPTLHLSLKSRTNHTLNVTVRATTQIERIIAHFVETHASSLPSEARGKGAIKLVFEGQALSGDSTVEDCELEDDDMLHVVW